MRHTQAMNGVLARALVDARLRGVDVAERLGVDPKTVQRWLVGRTPQPGHRRALAQMLDRHEFDLWPEVAREMPVAGELKATYLHRGAVPRLEWLQLFQHARSTIDVLAYSALFLVEDRELMAAIRARAEDGVKVRIALGDPDCPRVAQRGHDEGIGDAMAAKVRNALVSTRPLSEVPNLEIRLHETVLYDSMYRGDDVMFINTHVYGLPAAHAPVLKLVGDGELPRVYADAFERVWLSSRAPVPVGS